MQELKTIRLELDIMLEFMEHTPDVNSDSFYWVGDMPIEPVTYEPEVWQRTKQPIWMLWIEYLNKLKRADFVNYYNRAMELPIGNLLAASKIQGKER